MKKAYKAIVLFLAAVLLLPVFSLNIFASYDPETKADKITYRNFFGSARDVEVNGKIITADAYPVVIFLNEGARDENYYSEANYNGAVFLFSNAAIKADSNVVSLFYDYDQRHGDIRSCEYHIYAAAPETDADEAMKAENEIAVLNYDKDDQIYEEVATDTWTDFYSEANAGPMTSAVTLKAGNYDIYVSVQMVDIDDTFADDNLKDISAKLADIVFMNDPDAAAPTEKPTEAPTPTKTPAQETTEAPKNTESTDKSTAASTSAANTATADAEGSAAGNDGISPAIIVAIVVVAVVVIGGIIFFVRKKKKA